MYEAMVTISYRGRSVSDSALIDTGFTGGLLLPKETARSLGAPLVRPARYPRAVDGRVIRGSATILTVGLDAAGVSVETFVFCPNGEVPLLIGTYLLAQLGAVVLVGDARYESAESAALKPNRGAPDLGDWVLPTDRPVTPWW